MKNKSLTAIVACLGLVGSMTTSASAAECGPFVALGAGESRSVSYVDIGDQGLSQGDMRLGGRRLADQSGDPMGAYSWILTLQEPPDENGQGAVQINANMELDGGQLMMQAFSRNSGRLDDIDAVVVRPPVEFAIVGGTGVFAAASGTARLILSGSDAVFVTDVHCD